MKKYNSEELSLLFTKTIKETSFIHNGPVKGTMLMSPVATSIWNNIKREFEKVVLNSLEIEVEEVIFPTLLPQAMLEEEKNHIEGFAPELWKTRRKNSAEEIVLRPTSEVIFNKYFASREFSYKDLPIIWNQWANVFRIEENVKPFLRTSEFLWQEGHSFHETEREARELAIKMMEKYNKFMNSVLLLTTYKGEKTIAEKFAGAKRTYGVESIMLDGQSVQVATSHDLSNNFTKVFKGNYKTGGNSVQIAYGSSWGFSTRAMGAMLLSHMDDVGFVVPSKIASKQVVILAFDYNKWSEKHKTQLNNLKMKTELRIKVIEVEKNSGPIKWGYLKEGTPLVLNIGTRDFDKTTLNVVTRVKLEQEYSIKNPLTNDVTLVIGQIKAILSLIDKEIAKKLHNTVMDSLAFSKTKDEVISNIKEGKHTLAYISLTKEEEIKIKKENGFSIRVMILDSDKERFSHLKIEETKCVFTSKQNAKLALIARAY